MEEKISTSIQYQLTNVKLFNDIFFDWKNFNEDLNKGPEFMKNRLLQEWNELKSILKENTNLLLKDLDKEVTVSDFDITFNQSQNGTSVFFFTFPDYEYTDAASKYVALILAPKMPRFITLEYSENSITKEKQYVVGEFVINDQIKQRQHLNYGVLDNDRITFFAGYVLDMIDK